MNLSQLRSTLDRKLEETPVYIQHGRVEKAAGLLLEASGIRASVGDRCLLELTEGAVPAQVVGFSGQRSFLMPLAPLHGIRPGTRIVPDTDRTLPRASALLGRVVDALGCPLDGRPFQGERMPRRARDPLNPLERRPIVEALDVGVRSINSLLTVGVGQRLGIFAGSGVGKSVLLGMLARFTRADAVVVGLIGERGREVQEFVQEDLAEGLRKSIVVAAPADASPALRLQGAALAMEFAESLRREGKRVLLLMDSLTRVAQAQREIGLSMGEPPTAKGYPPSVFAALPQLIERAGQTITDSGSITAFFTVLMEEDDLQDPVVDAARAILDGHIVLSRRLADRGHYPAIDIESSISRLMQKLIDPAQRESVQRFRGLWSRYAEQEDLISVGAYQAGADPETDAAIRMRPALSHFLQQPPDQRVDLAGSRAQLEALWKTAAQTGAPGGNLPEKSRLVRGGNGA
ncbi:MAG: FliI/YscN family ATPase [Pseudomonadales bacterium]|nr:FliI/YscN family ATPase [Pseudomonadales bacterium]